MTTYQEDAPESAVKKSRIQELMDQFTNNEDSMSRALDVLSTRIEPILNPKASSESGDTQESLAAYSPLAKALQEASIKQRKNIRRLDTIIECIEL